MLFNVSLPFTLLKTRKSELVAPAEKGDVAVVQAGIRGISVVMTDAFR
jgi:hypothetical protein